MRCTRLLVLRLLILGLVFGLGCSKYAGNNLPNLSLLSRQKRQSDKEDKFQCGSGEQISESLVCNGERNCDDRSDETSETCFQRLVPPLALQLEPPLVSLVDKCLPSQHQCNYGKCVEISRRCDGRKDCPDGSDENQELCGELVTTKSPSNVLKPPENPPKNSSDCKLPEYPSNGKYQIVGCNSSPCGPGTIVSQTALLKYECEPGFKLSSDSYVFCDGLKWSSPFPTCQKVMCPPLQNPTRKIVCTLSNEFVNCNSSMQPGTSAFIKCNDYYTTSAELYSYIMACKENGQWSNVIHSCVPECGVSQPGGRPFISNGVSAKIAEYPWHVAIYDDNNFLRCGGTIVSKKIILSAAHCFWDENEKEQINSNKFKIAAGKIYRNWTKKEDGFQEAEIKSIILHPDYGGEDTNQAEDIAIVILNKSLTINEDVKPICVDTENKFSSNFDNGGYLGVVAGWGYTETQELSEVLQAVVLPVWDKRTCKIKLPETLAAYIAHRDKFCAGTNSERTVCPGDSGGGFAVRFANNTPYFLMGIVSTGVASVDKNCDVTQYALFTKISEHITFIKQYINNNT